MLRLSRRFHLISRYVACCLLVVLSFVVIANYNLPSRSSGPKDVRASQLFSLPTKLHVPIQTVNATCFAQPIQWDDRALHTAFKSELKIPGSRTGCSIPAPLFIGFASRYCMLEQTVRSYLLQGWPASQIVVFDNTGHSYENAVGSTSTDEHYHLNYSRLRTTLGVAVYSMPVRLSFAQYQNFLLHLARANGIADFYWSHQDVVVVEDEDEKLYPTLFDAVIAEQDELYRTFGPASTEWAFGYFSYDRLTHVNAIAADIVGYWDQLIPYYSTDCDYYGRSRRAGLLIYDFPAAKFYDVADCIPNTDAFWTSYDKVSAESKQNLVKMAYDKEHRPLLSWKFWTENDRNTWQGRNTDGTRSVEFGSGFKLQSDAGRAWYKAKWGTSDCDITRSTRGK